MALEEEVTVDDAADAQAPVEVLQAVGLGFKRLFKPSDEFSARLSAERIKILLPPADSWKLGRHIDAEERPIRRPHLEGEQESTMIIRHRADNLGDKSFAGSNQIIEIDRISGHASKAPLEFLSNFLL